jgi:hypothetical protein
MSSVVVGAPGVNGDSGAAYVLDAATGTILHTLNAQTAGESFGYSVARAGLVSNDPDEDILVGAPHKSGNGPQSGGLYFIHGRLGTLLSSVQGPAGSLLGFSAAGFDDVTGDGRADFLVGAPALAAGGVPSIGAAFLRETLAGGVPPLAIYSGDQPGEAFGFGVFRGGDRDGDGRSEVICSGPGWAGSVGTQQGRVGVYDSGGQVLFSATGIEPGEQFGTAVDGNGDFNGDGRPDLAVGAPGAGPGPLGDIGRVVIYPTEAIVSYGAGTGGLNTVDLSIAGQPLPGSDLTVRIDNGWPGGTSRIGISTWRDAFSIQRPDGVITLLLDRNLILPWATLPLDEDGSATLVTHLQPGLTASFSGLSLFFQANSLDPAGSRLRASNGVQVTVGY